jgi:TPR repeat protein/serine/threonine protein kinase
VAPHSDQIFGRVGGFGSIGPGSVIADDFEVQRPLGEGGMGSVYAVRQRSTGHERALKIMHPQLASNPMLRAKFVREAKIGSTIESDHIVQVIGAGIDEATGAPWLVMEMLQGQDLRAFVDRGGPPAPDLTLEIMRQIGHAVGAAHRVGVVHRDLKPENVFVARSRRHDVPFTVKVLDFGIAKIAAEAATQASVAIGSPLWMAPEQATAGANVSGAADVWALGLIAYFLFTGKIFWRAGDHESASAIAVLREVTLEEIPAPSVRAVESRVDGRLPPMFDRWFGRCVDRDPARRYPDGGAAIAAFEQMFARVLAPLSRGPGSSLQPSNTPSHHPSNAPRPLAPSFRGTPAGSGSSLESTGPRTVRDDWTGQSSPVLHPTHLGVAPRIPRTEPPGHTASGHTGPGFQHSQQWPPPYVPHQPTLQGSVFTSPEPARPAHGRKRGTSPLLIVGLLVPVLAGIGGGIYWFASQDAEPKKKGGKGKASSSVATPPAPPASDPTTEALRLFYDRNVPENAAKALELFKQGCDGGFADSCAGVGLASSTGHGAPQDRAEAAKRFQGACDKGSELGCGLLGEYLLFGSGGLAKDPARGASLMQKSCDANVMVACNALAIATNRGTGIPADGKKAVALFERACNGGFAPSCTSLGWQFESGTAMLHEPARAFELYKRGCDAGDMLGCTNLGHAYESSIGTTRDMSRAIALYTQACDAGNAVGCNNLGLAYRDGRGVAVDGGRAVQLFQKACDDVLDTEYLRGCTQLGIALQDGVGGEKDPAKGFTYIEKSCNGGNMAGCTALGYAYANARGVAKDEHKAALLYQQACDGGEMTGCNNVGYFYETGKVLEKDIHKAVARYGQACTNGSSLGCVNLGVLYYGGNGVPVNNGRAAELFEKACTLGNMLGCSNLGLMYKSGRGVTKDTARASALFKQACDGGNANGCDNLKK